MPMQIYNESSALCVLWAGSKINHTISHHNAMIMTLDSRKCAKMGDFGYFLLLFGFVIGQTPPNYSPSTSNLLNVTFNGNQRIYPGQALQPAGMSKFLSQEKLNKLHKERALIYP